MNNHTEFILTPITNILQEAVAASLGIGSGIETYPLYDYVMQSVFLKMTGSQEQKMKCIAWEIATNDFEYRYERFTKSKLGECSSYDEKKTIFTDLINQLKNNNENFDINTLIDKQTVLNNTKEVIKKIFSKTNLVIWAQNDFNQFEVECMKIKCECLNFEKTLFSNCSECSNYEKKSKKRNCNNAYNLIEKYASLYTHRNRSAHNTLSYQQNLPTLKTLASGDYQNHNYFLYFAILVLIDNIFMIIYAEYLKILKEVF